MRPFRYVLPLIASLMAAGSGTAQLPPPEDAEIPIALASTVSDVCFPVANGHALSAETLLILEKVTKSPSDISVRYPSIPTWYRLKKRPDNVFVGVGDKPGLCHVVLTDTKDGRQSFTTTRTALEISGYSSAWAPDGSAKLIFVKRNTHGYSLVTLMGLAVIENGVGPQVSVDVGNASEEEFRALFAHK